MTSQNGCSFKLFILPSIGITLIIMAVSSYFYAENQVKVNVHKNILLGPGSSAFNYWMNPPASILRKYYFFDISNPIEVQNGKEKPYLVQRGPYTYREIWDKKNVQFYGENLLHYSPTSALQFHPELSAGSENDEITFLNIPAISMIDSFIKSNEPSEVINIILAVTDSNLFIRRSIKDLISGYEDPLMALAEKMFPNSVKSSKFSLMTSGNGTINDNYTIMTGADLSENVGRIISWNGIEELNFWSTPYANMINGTDGTSYPPFRTKDQVVYSFSSNMCRSYPLVYLKDNKVKNIKVYDFHLPENVFANSTVNPDNYGFCTDDCLGNGVLNISTCYGGVSSFISQPHFLNADQKFLDALGGLKPDQQLHDFVLKFEPTTGVALSGNIRLQINFYVPQSENITAVKNIKPVLLPVIWFDDDVQLDDDTLNELSKVPLYVLLVNVVVYSILSIGITLTLVSLAYIFYKRYKANQTKATSNGSTSPDETTSLLQNNS